MPQENFNELAAFAIVATERSFTKAAAQLGVSQSALSQTMRNLESRLGLRLLTRTTRSVSPTEAGERLLRLVAPRFQEIQAEVAMLGDLHDKPTGTFRITAGDHAAVAFLVPALEKLLPDYPQLNVEINVNYGMTDIVADQYDAGVRLGDRVAKDMIAVRISPNVRWAVVGSPAYFASREKPMMPQELTAHRCINIRFPTHGALFPWDFRKDDQEVKVRVTGQLTVSNLDLRLKGALSGLGLAYIPEDQVTEQLASGDLVRVLEDWCPHYGAYYLYYPNRRHASSAFSLVVDTLRYQGPA